MQRSSVSDGQTPLRWERQDLTFAALVLASYFVVPIVALLVLQLFQPGLTIENLSGVHQILLQALTHCIILGLIAFLIAVVHGKPVLQTLRLIPPRSMAVGRLIAAGAILATTLLFVTLFFPKPSDSPLERLLTTTPAIVLFVVFGIVFAPLMEEIIFRGFLFSVLSDLLGGKAALVITSVLFAALHWAQLEGNLPAVGVILLVGYVLTLARHVTDSVVPSVIIHTAYNATIFLVPALATIVGLGGQPS